MSNENKINDLIIAKLDKLDERLDSQAETLIRNTVTLEDHVKRTNILEADMKPVKAHVNTVNLIAKIALGALALLQSLKSLGLF